MSFIIPKISKLERHDVPTCGIQMYHHSPAAGRFFVFLFEKIDTSVLINTVAIFHFAYNSCVEFRTRGLCKRSGW